MRAIGPRGLIGVLTLVVGCSGKVQALSEPQTLGCNTDTDCRTGVCVDGQCAAPAEGRDAAGTPAYDSGLSLDAHGGVVLDATLPPADAAPDH